MGYELDIKRNSENIITLTEWQEYIKNDPEFDATEEFSGTTKEGDTLTISTPNAGLWKNKVPFTFTEKLGHITVKNPPLPRDCISPRYREIVSPPLPRDCISWFKLIG